MCAFLRAVVAATTRLIYEARTEVAPREGMEALLYMRQLITKDDQLPETWATLNKKGGARFARHMVDCLLDHPVTEVMVPGIWPALVTCLALDVYRGARIGLLTGPPGAAKTDAVVTLIGMLAIFTEAKILATAHGNDTVAILEAALGSALLPVWDGGEVAWISLPSKEAVKSGVFDPKSKAPEDGERWAAALDAPIVLATTATVAAQATGHACAAFDFVFVDECQKRDADTPVLIVTTLAPGGMYVSTGDPQQFSSRYFPEMDLEHETAIAEAFVSGIYHPLVGSSFSCFCAAAALGLSQAAKDLRGTAPREEDEGCGLTEEELMECVGAGQQPCWPDRISVRQLGAGSRVGTRPCRLAGGRLRSPWQAPEHVLEIGLPLTSLHGL